MCACAGVAQGMFEAAKVFNQPLAAWDVGQVVDMEVRRRPHWVSEGRGMGARAARSGLGRLSLRVRWHCAQEMFYRSHRFNQPVAAWDVGKVTTMEVRRCPC